MKLLSKISGVVFFFFAFLSIFLRFELLPLPMMKISQRQYSKEKIDSYSSFDAQHIISGSALLTKEDLEPLVKVVGKEITEKPKVEKCDDCKEAIIDPCLTNFT